MYKRVTIFFIMTSIGMCGANTQTETKKEKPNLYQIIAQENLKAIIEISLNNDERALNSLLEEEKEFYEVMLEKVEAQLNPTPGEKRKKVFKLLSQYEKDHPLQTNDTLDKKSWQDLELLCGPKSNPGFYVASQIDRTSTEIGRAMLYRKIIQPKPACNIKMIKKQQLFIKELISNERLFNELDNKLSQLSNSENSILSFWEEDILKSLMESQLLPTEVGSL